MNKEEARQIIIKKAQQTEKLIPAVLEPNLPPTALSPNVPGWHSYEHKIWMLGEEIRQVLVEFPALRTDVELNQLFLTIATNRKAKRGRQSFIMLFSSKKQAGYAPELVTQVDDEFVDGHVLDALLKMKVAGYTELMKQYREHNITWIRNTAKKYLSR